jgi:hypothetical protein
MKVKVHWYAIFTLLLTLVLLSGIACHEIFKYEFVNTPTWDPYFCSATIYRDLPDGKKFTHYYVTHLWPDYDWDQDGQPDDDDAYILCSMQIEDYIDHYMAPDFTWKKENITVSKTVGTMAGADCCDVEPVFPIYGGPWGSAILWSDAGSQEIPREQAYVWFRLLDKDGQEHIGEPYVEYASIILAEHTGLPDSSGNYDRKKEHFRISNMAIELKDFWIGKIKVTRFHIHSIGSVVSKGSGLGAIFEPETIKLYMYATGEIEGEKKITSQCILNDRGTGIGYINYPSQYFIFQLDTKIDIGGLPMWVKIVLVSPNGKPFSQHQPYVTLPYKWEATSPVDLTPYFSYDHDNNLAKFLWFENFEDSNEIFLGEGQTINDVTLSVGEHEITVVAYDILGAYNTYTSTLTILPDGGPVDGPVAVNDSYEVKEDNVLNVPAPGVLDNDQPAVPGGTLKAIKVSDPTNGILQWSSNNDGSFTYTPDPLYFGEDSFTYSIPMLPR